MRDLRFHDGVRLMARYHRVEDVLDDVIDEESRTRAITDWRFQKNTAYGRRAAVEPKLDPARVAAVREQIVRYSESTLAEGSPLPRMETLETMTPEKRAEMERLYGPMTREVKRRVAARDHKRGGRR